MKKKATPKKAKAKKLSPIKRWEQTVKKEIPPGRMIPDELAEKAPA